MANKYKDQMANQNWNQKNQVNQQGNLNQGGGRKSEGFDKGSAINQKKQPWEQQTTRNEAGRTAIGQADLKRPFQSEDVDDEDTRGSF
ncbi:MAG: hypothetical protein V4534_06455 [Myxococcota bacterium]